MSKTSPDYSTFSATDFVLDENFVRWVQEPTAENILFWKNWLQNNPEKQTIILDAKALIQHIRFRTDYNTQEDIDQTWNILSEKFDNYNQPKFLIFRNTKFLLRVAASFALLGLMAAFVWIQISGSEVSKTYKTGNGEISTIKLSDSTQIILNANSRLTVSMHTGWFPKRETWLHGEAFFKVKKQKNPVEFIVHTSNVNVHVLGTEFNVQNRHAQSTVVLNDGKIKINNTIGPAQERIMKPGDLVAFSDTSRTLMLRLVNPENHFSWIYKKLIFEHTRIADVAHLLEDTYGLSVVISKPALANRTFTATLPSNNLPVLLKAIEESFNVNIKQLNKQLIITDK